MLITSSLRASDSGASPRTDVTAAQLPRYTTLAAILFSAALSSAVFWIVASGNHGALNIGGTVFLAVVVYLLVIGTLSRVVEGRRRATDRIMSTLIVTAFLLALAPLVSVTVTVVLNGMARFDSAFFTESMRNVVGAGGGALHAVMGTLVITGIATVMSVPIGLLTAIYLVEYGHGKLRWAITFFVDVMTGVPSIVAGLFAFALLALITGDPGVRSGFGGALALSVLMIPVVVRSSEEMLRLVPNELREASYALGVPKWRTVVKVVLPTAMAGIVTGVMIAIARVIGETAPLLIIAGFTTSMNYNPFSGWMMTLPVFTYDQYANKAFPPEVYDERAWTGALTLILLVAVLNIVARIVAKLFAPKTGR